jgi:hypothetical protein
MNSFRNWYVRNQDAITWFVIGWLAWGGVDSLASGDYFWAAVNAVLIYVNYKFLNLRMQ